MAISEAFIKSALKKAQEFSDGKPLNRCLAFKNAVGFLFEDPDNPTIGGPGYIIVYENGQIDELPTNFDSFEILRKGIPIEIPE